MIVFFFKAITDRCIMRASHTRHTRYWIHIFFLFFSTVQSWTRINERIVHVAKTWCPFLTGTDFVALPYFLQETSYAFEPTPIVYSTISCFATDVELPSASLVMYCVSACYAITLLSAVFDAVETNNLRSHMIRQTSGFTYIQQLRQQNAAVVECRQS